MTANHPCFSMSIHYQWRLLVGLLGLFMLVSCASTTVSDRHSYQGGKSPGLVVPALVTIATANPIGLVVGGAVKGAGEVTGKSGAEGSAARIADAVAETLVPMFKEQGWI